MGGGLSITGRNEGICPLIFVPNQEYASWKDVCLWGLFKAHVAVVKSDRPLMDRVVHLVLAALEFLPGLSQIVSVIECAIAKVLIGYKGQEKPASGQETVHVDPRLPVNPLGNGERAKKIFDEGVAFIKNEYAKIERLEKGEKNLKLHLTECLVYFKDMQDFFNNVALEYCLEPCRASEEFETLTKLYKTTKKQLEKAHERLLELNEAIGLNCLKSGTSFPPFPQEFPLPIDSLCTYEYEEEDQDDITFERPKNYAPLLSLANEVKNSLVDGQGAPLCEIWPIFEFEGPDRDPASCILIKPLNPAYNKNEFLTNLYNSFKLRCEEVVVNGGYNQFNVGDEEGCPAIFFALNEAESSDDEASSGPEQRSKYPFTV